MIPPFKTPGNASYFGCGCHSATTSPFLAKLRIRKPSRFDGPQPQHEFSGAYFSWSDGLSMVDRAVPCSMLKVRRRRRIKIDIRAKTFFAVHDFFELFANDHPVFFSGALAEIARDRAHDRHA